MVRLRPATATSAGGIVVRYESGRAWLVVGSRRRERDGWTWTLPKGTPKPGESREETALREVAEESGLQVPVHYFMMEPTGGDLANHDHEFEQVRWITFDEAPSVLTFETERILVARAAGLLDAAAPNAPDARSAEIAP